MIIFEGIGYLHDKPSFQSFVVVEVLFPSRGDDYSHFGAHRTLESKRLLVSYEGNFEDVNLLQYLTVSKTFAFKFFQACHHTQKWLSFIAQHTPRTPSGVRITPEHVQFLVVLRFKRRLRSESNSYNGYRILIGIALVLEHLESSKNCEKCYIWAINEKSLTPTLAQCCYILGRMCTVWHRIQHRWYTVYL